MRAVGPGIVLLALATWVFEIVLAWTLIFQPSVFKEPDGVSFSDRFVFAGKSIIGRSGNTPALEVDGAWWEMIQGFAGLTGVVVISVGLAYVLPILAAVAQKRSVASSLHAIGDSVNSMYECGTTDKGKAYHEHLLAMVPQIALSAERHRSYPVLHYFHSSDPHAALAPAVAKVGLLFHADLSELPELTDTVTEPVAHSIHNLLEALGGMGLRRYAREADTIDRDKLNELDIDPRVPPPATRLPNIEWLKAYVQFDGWEWDTIKDETGETPGLNL